MKHYGNLISTMKSVRAATEAEHAKSVYDYFVRAAAVFNVLEAGWKN